MTLKQQSENDIIIKVRRKPRNILERYEVCSLQELEEELEEEDRKDYKKSIVLIGIDPQPKDKHCLPLRTKST